MPALHSLHTAIDILTLFGVAGGGFIFFFRSGNPKRFVSLLLSCFGRGYRMIGAVDPLLCCCFAVLFVVSTRQSLPGHEPGHFCAFSDDSTT